VLLYWPPTAIPEVIVPKKDVTPLPLSRKASGKKKKP
jgi:hypothetical protein